jgi:hypothetical protein
MEGASRARRAMVTGSRAVLARSVAPPLVGVVLAGPLLGLPFFLAGGMKGIYDLALWARFRGVPLAVKR